MVHRFMADSILSDPSRSSGNGGDVEDLRRFGYGQQLRRALGPVASFAIAFSMISITYSIFFLFSTLFATSGGIGVWEWIPAGIGVFMIVLVYSHLAARIPVTGFAYQWTTRLTNNHYGYFTGWACLCAFWAGSAAVATGIGTIFAPDIWSSPSQGDVVLLAAIAIVVGVILNAVSIRVVAWVNNAGALLEIFGTVLAAVLLFIGYLVFFHHSQGFHILVQRGAVQGGVPLWYGLVLASLLPVFTLLGWEGAADLSEETNDPRRTTPKAMIRANYVSIGFGLFIVIAFLIAIPHSLKGLVSQPQNLMLYIFKAHFGAVGSDLLQVAVFFAVFSCMVANQVVATRVTYAMARDNLLPGSRLLSAVHPRTRTPLGAIILVGVIGLVINLLGSGIATRVVSIVSTAYYLIYLLVVVGAMYAVRKGRVPDLPTGGGYFSLGRWLKPVMVIALLWIIAIILADALPAEGHVAAEYTLGAVGIGVLWYLFGLRRRLISKRAGVGRVVSAEDETHSGVLRAASEEVK
jgi:amino acid transporter